MNQLTRSLLLLLFLTGILFGCPSSKQENTTVAGVFSLFEPDTLEGLGAKAVRVILQDDQIQSLFDAVDSGTPLEDIDIYQQLISLKNKEIEVIVTTRWPDPADGHFDRVPAGKDRTDSLALLTRFLNEIGPYISCLALQNEVGGNGPGTYYDADMTEDAEGTIPAIEWFKDVAQTAREGIEGNASLSHLIIASPVPIALYAAVFYEDFDTIDPVKANFFYALIEFADKYTDALDIHLLKVDFDEIDDMIDYLESRTSIPLISTEWSEVKHMNDWLQEDIDSSFKGEAGATLDLESITTNQDFVTYCYENPVSQEIWNTFVKTSPHDAAFMEDSFTLFSREGFLYACWALGLQYKEPQYDMRTIFAQLTASGDTPKNEMIYNEFLNLTTKINNGMLLKEN